MSPLPLILLVALSLPGATALDNRRRMFGHGNLELESDIDKLEAQDEIMAQLHDETNQSRMNGEESNNERHKKNEIEDKPDLSQLHDELETSFARVAEGKSHGHNPHSHNSRSSNVFQHTPLTDLADLEKNEIEDKPDLSQLHDELETSFARVAEGKSHGHNPHSHNSRSSNILQHTSLTDLADLGKKKIENKPDLPQLNGNIEHKSGLQLKLHDELEAEDEDMAQLHDKLETSFARVAEGKSHGHNPHRHNPHGHIPHAHNPHAHNPHFHTPRPTKYPTKYPTKVPTVEPTLAPVTEAPTRFPTKFPTPRPTKFPTPVPTKFPTPVPSRQPTLMLTSSA
eukprot:jgi/Bigna1/90365/estExt_fgenesh1_pg.C_680051